MLRNIKTFFNLEFRIEECEDDVYDDGSDDEVAVAEAGEEGEAE